MPLTSIVHSTGTLVIGTLASTLVTPDVTTSSSDVLLSTVYIAVDTVGESTVVEVGIMVAHLAVLAQVVGQEWV